jgi:hypothetical protein
MADDLAAVDKKIRATWAALCGARAVCWHSMNAETMRVEAKIETGLNELLEQRYRIQQAEAMVQA